MEFSSLEIDLPQTFVGAGACHKLERLFVLFDSSFLRVNPIEYP